MMCLMLLNERQYAAYDFCFDLTTFFSEKEVEFTDISGCLVRRGEHPEARAMADHSGSQSQRGVLA